MVPSWADQLLLQLLMEQFDTSPNNVDTLNICMKEFGSEFFFLQNDSSENLDIFSLVRCLYMHRWCLCVDQLLPQLLIEQFDTLPIQCRHIEHMHEGVWFRKKYFLTK